MFCELCGCESKKLFILTVEQIEESKPVLSTNFKFERSELHVCRECYELIEGESPVEISRSPKKQSFTISINRNMAAVLQMKSAMLGYLSIIDFIHAILFREAVASHLEDLGEQEIEEQEAAFTREMRDWLKSGC